MKSRVLVFILMCLCIGQKSYSLTDFTWRYSYLDNIWYDPDFDANTCVVGDFLICLGYQEYNNGKLIDKFVFPPRTIVDKFRPEHTPLKVTALTDAYNYLTINFNEINIPSYIKNIDQSFNGVGCNSKITDSFKINFDGQEYISGFNDLEDLEEVNFPSTLKEIGNDSFKSCHMLKTLKLPENLEKIGDLAFTVLHELEELDLGNVKSIGAGCFTDCYMIGNLVLPESLEYIGEESFSFWYLEGLELPSNPIVLDNVFLYSAFLKKIVCKSEEPYPIHNDAFGWLNSDKPIVYVPEGCLDAYRNDPKWGRFTNIIEMPAEVSSISEDSQNFKILGKTITNISAENLVLYNLDGRIEQILKPEESKTMNSGIFVWRNSKASGALRIR